MKAAGLSLVLTAAGIIACSQQSSFKGGAKSGAIPPTPVPAVAPAPAPVPSPKSGNSTPPAIPAPAPVPVPETPGIFKDCETSQSSKFLAKLYKLPEGTNQLPDFPSLSPLKEVCLNQLDIATRKFTDGFPGVGKDLIEWFALDIYFDVTITEEANYRIRLLSDDGSRLKVDGKLLIDNDGQHGPQSKDATIVLSPGTHKFNLAYFQGPRDQIALELFWKKADAGDESYLPLEMVSRPK